MSRIVVVLMLVLVVGGSFAGCGDDDHLAPFQAPTPVPTTRPLHPSTFTGTYDVELAGDLGAPADLVGVVLGDDHFDDLHLTTRIDARTALDVVGRFAADATATLAGSISLPRRSIPVVGRAAASRSPETLRIVGALRAENSFLDTRVTFTFERPVDAKPDRFSGTYRFAFDPSPSGCGCASSATFQVSVQRNGFGTIDYAASDLDAGGSVIGTFLFGDCPVTPSGRISCLAAYVRAVATPVPERPTFGAFLFGRLDFIDPAVMGTGRVDADPSADDALTPGAWTATRIAR